MNGGADGIQFRPLSAPTDNLYGSQFSWSIRYIESQLRTSPSKEQTLREVESKNLVNSVVKKKDSGKKEEKGLEGSKADNLGQKVGNDQRFGSRKPGGEDERETEER